MLLGRAADTRPKPQSTGTSLLSSDWLLSLSHGSPRPIQRLTSIVPCRLALQIEAPPPSSTLVRSRNTETHRKHKRTPPPTAQNKAKKTPRKSTGRKGCEKGEQGRRSFGARDRRWSPERRRRRRPAQPGAGPAAARRRRPSRAPSRPASSSPSAASGATSSMDATPSASAPAPLSTSPPSSSTSPPSSWSWRGTRRGTTRRTGSSRGTCCSRSATTRSSGSCWPASPSPTEVSCPTSTPCCFPRRPQRRLPRSPRRAPPSRPGSPPPRRRPTLRPGTRYAGAPSHPLPLLCLSLCLGSTVKHLVVVVVVSACRRCHGSIAACLYLFCVASA